MLWRGTGASLVLAVPTVRFFFFQLNIINPSIFCMHHMLNLRTPLFNICITGWDLFAVI